MFDSINRIEATRRYTAGRCRWGIHIDESARREAEARRALRTACIITAGIVLGVWAVAVAWGAV